MGPEIGHIAVIFAFLIAILQAILPTIGVQKDNIALQRVGMRAAQLQFLLIALGFVCLTYAFLQSDLTVKLVALHSHESKPFIYKLTGVWGNHEGSILLWVLIMAGFGAAFTLLPSPLGLAFQARVCAIMGGLSVAFLGFILATSNAFERLYPAADFGQGLNPLLQDLGLAIHPPMLYVGYVGFAIPFAFAVAGLWAGKVDASWAKALRPWTLVAWSALTLGIVLGSIWAYYELGWGGWWFWDPVENVSFMPWLAGTALIHSLMVAQKRQGLTGWSVLLAIMAFSLSLIGTFIVRSGVLTSVHAFAVDPARGVYILAILIGVTGAALALFAARSHKIESQATFDTVSREGALLINNILLVVACATVFLGTFYPLLIDATMGDKITVGPPYFNWTFAPIMSILIIFMGWGPLVAWRQEKPEKSRLTRRSLESAAIGLAAGLLTLILSKSIGGAFGIALAVWLIAASLRAYIIRLLPGKATFSDLPKQILRAPWTLHGFFLGHVGLAVTVLGITSMEVWAKEDIARLKQGETLALSGYTFILDGMEYSNGPNYESLQGHFTVKRGLRREASITAEQRYYPVEQQMTTEAALSVWPMRTLYATFGEGDVERGWTVRVYYHPLVSWIWAGAIIMMVGGLMSALSSLRSMKQGEA